MNSTGEREIRSNDLSSSRTCIVVDDEPMARRFLSEMIRNYTQGVTIVGEADSVDGAVALIKKEHPDIVFLDLELIGGSGFEVLERTDPSTFRTVCISASNNHVAETLRYPNTTFLFKPISIQELRDALCPADNRAIQD
jgi:two-component system, LytTR family, response regulator